METDKISFRSQGRKLPGRLVKGFVYDSKMKSTISSIPSKFETVVYKTYSQKGFLNSSERFENMKTKSENPGPGSYSLYDAENSILTKASTSYSQKGYGNGFLSKSLRNSFGRKYINSGPGPGSYDSLSDLNPNRSYSSSFKTMKRQTLDDMKQKTLAPGPCTYEINTKGKINPYHSSFISRSNRENYLGKGTTPPPGAYNLRKGFVYKDKNNYPAFAQPYERKKEKLQLKELEKIVEGEPNNSNPGPGDYEPKPVSNKYEEGNSNFYFKSSEKTRFGDWQDSEKQKRIFRYPGPGTYIKEEESEENEELMTKGAVFSSTTKRVPFGNFEKRMGPNPKMITKSKKKKSFHMNLSQDWI